MSNIDTLEKLLKDDVLVELEENINELTELIDKKSTSELKEELKYMKDVKAYFEEAILNIENKSMTEEIALDLLEGLENMRYDDEDI